MSQTTSSQILVRSEDRRRHPRQKASSITYLEFGDDNGGILLNLGGGGLSLQAVSKLNPGQELTLRFGLFSDQETIDVSGRIIWLSPTRKEAGITFLGLSDSASEIIEKWLAAHDAERISAEWKPRASNEGEPAKNEIHLLPPQFSVASGFPKRDPLDLDERPSPSTAIQSEARLGASLLDHALNRAKTSPVFGTYVPTLMPTRLASHPTERPDSYLANAPEESLETNQPVIRVLRADPPAISRDVSHFEESAGFPRNVQVSLGHASPDSTKPLSSPSAVSTAPIREALSLLVARAQLHRRPILLTAAGAAGCLAILLLLLIVTSLGTHPVNDAGSTVSVEPLNPSSRPEGTVGPATTVGVPGGTNSGTIAKSAGAQQAAQSQTKTSSPAIAGATADSAPTPVPEQIAPQIVQQGSSSSWLEVLQQIFFGVQDKPKLDPAVTRVPVWADQRTGFYYCDNGPYFVKPERVSLLKQGEALQSGFQPKLGTYCY